jgi:hypothetical protein
VSGPEFLQSLIHDSLRKEREALEHLCEIMLITPDSPGISVQRTYRYNEFSCQTFTKIDPAVPFGEIHYLPDVHG